MKNLLCLISIVLFLAACSNDSTDTASQPASSPAKPAEETVQKVADTTQSGVNEAASASSTPSVDNGSGIYEQNCRSCHDSGLMGAPKLGNDRFGADTEVLVENSIKGIGQMPARGGNSSLSDTDVRAAVMYMVEQSN